MTVKGYYLSAREFDLTDEDYCWKYLIYEIFQKETHIENYEGCLFHYTSLEGFVGILTSQKIWVTEYSFLNDSSELEYGLSIVKNLLQSYISVQNEPYILGFLTSALEQLNNTKLSNQLYVASFSEHKDQLSQWKGYAQNGGGVSIGFDFKGLTRWKRGDILDINIYIKPIVYDQSDQENEIVEILENLINHIKALNSEKSIDSDKLVSIANCLASFLVKKSIFYKNPAFKEESEWRIVYNNIGTAEVEKKKVKFRIVDSKIIPYIELLLVPEKSKLPIKEIVYGAKNRANELEKVLQLLYDNFETIDEIPNLVGSGIPLK